MSFDPKPLALQFVDSKFTQQHCFAHRVGDPVPSTCTEKCAWSIAHFTIWRSLDATYGTMYYWEYPSTQDSQEEWSAKKQRKRDETRRRMDLVLAEVARK